MALSQYQVAWGPNVGACVIGIELCHLAYDLWVHFVCLLCYADYYEAY